MPCDGRGLPAIALDCSRWRPERVACLPSWAGGLGMLRAASSTAGGSQVRGKTLLPTGRDVTAAGDLFGIPAVGHPRVVIDLRLLAPRDAAVATDDVGHVVRPVAGVVRKVGATS